jgi:hypothetical protein
MRESFSVSLAQVAGLFSLPTERCSWRRTIQLEASGAGITHSMTGIWIRLRKVKHLLKRPPIGCFEQYHVFLRQANYNKKAESLSTSHIVKLARLLLRYSGDVVLGDTGIVMHGADVVQNVA